MMKYYGQIYLYLGSCECGCSKQTEYRVCQSRGLGFDYRWVQGLVSFLTFGQAKSAEAGKSLLLTLKRLNKFISL